MIDGRRALPREYEFQNNTVIYRIVEEIGRGANCIVYNATYSDSSGLQHLVRVKELYPIHLGLTRDKNNEICCDECSDKKFYEAKKRFVATYERNVVFKNTYGVMNSTVNASDRFSTNGTIYVVMSLDEGENYRSYMDRSLQELLVHVKALALVIKKYHDEGYLHLDIKPENVFIIPETAEHVYLFDFDSVCKIEDLALMKMFDLSYTEGFSAPEQIQGNISRIGVRTDIYAIGAVLFYKLFNRRPSFEEGRYSAFFNYKEMVFYDEKLRPKFYKCLDEFMHKTLAISTSLRWNSMTQVIESLEELVKLSDLKEPYLIDTFTYNSAYFVGRLEEIEEIHEGIQDNNVLFLSGIGGIGKTELAKKYISEYRNEFDTVAVIYFQESIEHTVCQEILINNMSIEEDEKENEYFDRVLDALRKNATNRDLILLDNFDIERDDRLEELLKCPCRFLITTRNRNIRDWNYNEIKIGRMDNEDDLMSLFMTYNDEIYDSTESVVIDNIINLVDGHTMTIELISKYLRDSGQLPSILYNRFKEESGITNTDDNLIVNQRKDFKMNSESVNTHLSILFDVFGFDDVSKVVISSLSLFAGIRIKRDRFEVLCEIDNIDIYLDKLIRGGWVEQNEITGKISLHQVIQDLIYTKLKPSSENCPGIADGMYKYIKTSSDSYVERSTKRKVYSIFAERIQGKNLAYAKICLAYGKRKKLEEAIRICKKVKSEESYDVLTKLYMENIRELCKCDDMFVCEEPFDEYGKSIALQIDVQFGLAINSFISSIARKQEKLLPGLINLGGEMSNMMNEFVMNGCFDNVKEIDLIYQRITKLFDKVDCDFLELNISFEEKEKLLETIRDFYSDGDYCALYRWEHYSDLKKVVYYQELLDKIRGKKKAEDSKAVVSFYAGDSSYSDIADEYMLKKNYEMAIELYKKAYDEGDEPFDWICPRLSEAYYKMGDIDSSIECLKSILDADKDRIADKNQIGHYSGDISISLINILDNVGRINEAKQYAQELIRYKALEIQEGQDNSYSIKNIIVGYWYLYLYVENLKEKDAMWKRCIDLYIQLGEEKLEAEHYDFIREYVQKENVELDKIIRIIDQFEPVYEKNDLKIHLIEEVINAHIKQEAFKRYHISLLIKCAEISGEFLYNDSKKALDYCKKARKLLMEIVDEDGYYESKISQVMAEVMSNDTAFEYDEVAKVRKQCNYYIVAEHDSAEVDFKKKIEIWNEAANNYYNVDDYENQLRCLNQSYVMMVPILNQYDYSMFDYPLWNIMYNQVLAWIELEKYDKASKVIEEMYVRVIDYYEMRTAENNKRNFCKRIKEIANCFEQAKDCKNALHGFLMWIYIILSESYDNQILKAFFKNEQDIKLVCDKLIFLIQSAESDVIDYLIDFKSEVGKLNMNETERKLIQPIFDIITKDYQNKEIEFK